MKSSHRRTLLFSATTIFLILIVTGRILLKDQWKDFEVEKKVPTEISQERATTLRAKTLLQSDHTTGPGDSSQPDTSGDNGVATRAGLEKEIGNVRIEIEAANDGDTSERLLNRLAREFIRANPATAAAAIVRFLDSGDDAATRLPFRVGEGGSLDFAPTLRAFLLDQLGQLDPVEAPAYSSEIFRDSDSPAEWALAMRNLAWTNSNGKHTAEIRQRFGEMLSRREWIQAPEAALFEAFDFGVYLSGKPEWDRLTELVGSEIGKDTGIEDVAMMAIDRILLNQRDLAFRELESNRSLLEKAPVQRATLAARADLTRPGERRALESYLLRSDLSNAERNAFFELFPLRSYTEGHRLASSGEPRKGLSEVAANDLATLEVVRRWKNDPAFDFLAPRIAELELRLEGWAREIQENADRSATAPNRPRPGEDGSAPGFEGR